MSDYRLLGRPDGTGAVDKGDARRAKVAYEAWAIAMGERDWPAWEKLVWKEQYAWLEAGRAARAHVPGQ